MPAHLNSDWFGTVAAREFKMEEVKLRDDLFQIVNKVFGQGYFTGFQLFSELTDVVFVVREGLDENGQIFVIDDLLERDVMLYGPLVQEVEDDE